MRDSVADMGLFSSIRGMFRGPRDSTKKLQALASGPPITKEQIVEHMAGMNPRERRDAWQNILTAVGTHRDSRTAGEFEVEPVTFEEARDLWRGDDIAKRIIETLPKDGMRRGWDVKFDDKKKAEAVENTLRALAFNNKFKRAGMFERAYGGAAIYPVINDSNSDLTNPLDVGAVELPKSFTLWNARDLRPVSYYGPESPFFGEVEVWRLQPRTLRGQQAQSTIEIHESRLIIFPGVRVDREQPMGCEEGWGDSVLTVVRHVLRDYNLSWGAAILLLQEIKVGIYKMNKLGQLIEHDRDDEVSKRIVTMDIAKSVINSIVIDKEDDYEIENTSPQGAADLLGKFEVRMAAAADMPVTKLLGQSPAGMNATGESDISIHDDNVGSYQDEHMPQLTKGVRFVLLAQDGPTKGKEPKNWSCEYRPLRTPTAKEEADRRLVVMQTDQGYHQMQVYSSDEIRTNRFGGDAYSAEMVLDNEHYEEMKLLASPEETAEDPDAMAALGRDPAAAAPTAPGAAADVQKAALNGAQVKSLVDVVIAVVTKQIPRESGAQIIRLANPTVDPTTANALLGPEDFEAATPPAKPGAGAPFPQRALPAPAEEEEEEEEVTEDSRNGRARRRKRRDEWNPDQPRAEDGTWGEGGFGGGGGAKSGAGAKGGGRSISKYTSSKKPLAEADDVAADFLHAAAEDSPHKSAITNKVFLKDIPGVDPKDPHTRKVLLELHQKGEINLVRSDLTSPENYDKRNSSEIADRGATFHQIQLPDKPRTPKARGPRASEAAPAAPRARVEPKKPPPELRRRSTAGLASGAAPTAKNIQGRTAKQEQERKRRGR